MKEGKNLISEVVRCRLGLKLLLQVNSLMQRKPKKAKVNAAQTIMLSGWARGISKSNMVYFIW